MSSQVLSNKWSIYSLLQETDQTGHKFCTKSSICSASNVRKAWKVRFKNPKISDNVPTLKTTFSGLRKLDVITEWIITNVNLNKPAIY